jgi:hypothetical protein
MCAEDSLPLRQATGKEVGCSAQGIGYSLTGLPVGSTPSVAPCRGIILGRIMIELLFGGTELQVMNPEGESIKPDEEDEDGSKDIDTEDLDSDKTEGAELKQ